MLRQQATSAIAHIVYDKNTGRIVHTHYCFKVEDEQYTEVDPGDVLSLVTVDDSVMRHVTDQDPANLEVLMTTDLPEAEVGISGFIVDVEAQKIVRKSEIVLSADKTELNADGTDTTDITINVVDAEGAIVEDYHGEIKVATTRGSLSEKGGLVTLQNGTGYITLTSVSETVSRVVVTARCTGGTCSKGSLVLEFV